MDGVPAFSKLFEPIEIGSMTVKNRFVVPAMGTGFATPDGLITQQSLDYYEARARGGAGMVVTECACVDFPRGIHASRRLVVDNDAALPGLTALAAVIRKHGARAVMQLSHAGRMAKSALNGIQPVAPSAVAAPSGEVPRELAVDEIAGIVQLFAQAAGRARKAGFDALEVHAAHGYLLANFCSPFSNRRQDAYGGSVENRARMLIEVLSAIRARVGREFPLWCRLNAREYGVADGLTLQDGQAIARMMNGLVDAVSVSTKGYRVHSYAGYPDEPGALLPLAAEIRRVVSVPVIAVGALNAETGKTAIERGQADLIALGRQSIADPDVPNKIRSGRMQDIRPCIACFHCFDVGLLADSHIACQVNAALGNEKDSEPKRAATPRKVAVVGGGPAGLEASRVLALRGHEVVLFEKKVRLGGLLTVGAVPPHKQRLEALVDYFEAQLQQHGVEIRLNTEADVDAIACSGARAVVIATGSIPGVPAISGVDGNHVHTAIDILAGRIEAGHSVVVIGGGSTGCETAEFLLGQGRQVSVVEISPQLALDAGASHRRRLLNRLAALPITVLTGTRCTRIERGGILACRDDGTERFYPADTVVLAVGATPNNALFQELHARGVEAHMAGDCWCPGRIARAISDGFRLGRTL